MEFLRDKRLWRLLRIRWSGQLTDGIFQSALASFVLFSPERQASATNAAVGFAVVLLPYSIIGPFVGTVLDRYSRKRAIFFSNLIRSATLIVIALMIFGGASGVELTAVILIAFGVNRLILAGLSAGLPLMTEPHRLIAVNAVAVTGGSIFVVLGGGIGLGTRKLIDALTSANHADAIVILIAASGYLISALFASRLKKNEIGPLEHESQGKNWSDGFAEMRDGFRFLRNHSDAARGILATAVHRGGITALTLTTLLLERNTFHDPADTEAGLAGVSTTLTIAAVGFGIGAVIAPFGVERFGRHRFIRYALFASALGPIPLILTRTPISLALTGFLVALCGQCVKVTNDALVQSKIDDFYRGRVFSVYDVLVNGAIILGGLIAAAVLPISGDTLVLPLLVSAAYALTSLLLLRGSVFPPRK